MPERDAAYMNAVESGDMEMAQQMVNEAARKAGKHCGKWFHGSPQSERFEIFTPKPERSFGVPSNAIGSWFTPDEEQARAFAEEMDGVGHESCPGKNGRGSSDLVREVGRTLEDLRPHWNFIGAFAAQPAVKEELEILLRKKRLVGFVCDVRTNQNRLIQVRGERRCSVRGSQRFGAAKDPVQQVRPSFHW